MAETMEPTSRRCARWGILCFVAAAVITVLTSQFYSWFASTGGQAAETLFAVVEPLASILRSVMFPLGAALIGAAVVIQWLAGRVRGESRPLQ